MTLYELPCEIAHLQKAELSQTGRPTLRVVENFAKYQDRAKLHR